MKLYTISETISEGIQVDTLALKGTGKSIPAIIIGDDHPRRRGVITVQLLPHSYELWLAAKSPVIRHAQLGRTQSGAPKLIEIPSNQDTDTDRFIAYMDTRCGYRGGNSHTGDRKDLRFDAEGIPEFHAWPGDDILNGCVYSYSSPDGSLGIADKKISILPVRTVFRTGFSGRRYGSPAAWYFYHDGSGVIQATWKERMAAEIF